MSAKPSNGATTFDPFAAERAFLEVAKNAAADWAGRAHCYAEAGAYELARFAADASSAAAELAARLQRELRERERGA